MRRNHGFRPGTRDAKTLHFVNKCGALDAQSRRGAMRALFAIAHKLARAVYRVITTGQPYRDLGANYLDEKNKTDVVRQLVNRLKRLTTSDEIAAYFRPDPNMISPT